MQNKQWLNIGRSFEQDINKSNNRSAHFGFCFVRHNSALKRITLEQWISIEHFSNSENSSETHKIDTFSPERIVLTKWMLVCFGGVYEHCSFAFGFFLKRFRYLFEFFIKLWSVNLMGNDGSSFHVCSISPLCRWFHVNWNSWKLHANNLIIPISESTFLVSTDLSPTSAFLPFRYISRSHSFYGVYPPPLSFLALFYFFFSLLYLHLSASLSHFIVISQYFLQNTPYDEAHTRKMKA